MLECIVLQGKGGRGEEEGEEGKRERRCEGEKNGGWEERGRGVCVYIIARREKQREV